MLQRIIGTERKAQGEQFWTSRRRMDGRAISETAYVYYTTSIWFHSERGKAKKKKKRKKAKHIDFTRRLVPNSLSFQF